MRASPRAALGHFASVSHVDDTSLAAWSDASQAIQAVGLFPPRFHPQYVDR
jgi:hypothetical protein